MLQMEVARAVCERLAASVAVVPLPAWCFRGWLLRGNKDAFAGGLGVEEPVGLLCLFQRP